MLVQGLGALARHWVSAIVLLLTGNAIDLDIVYQFYLKSHTKM